MAKYYKKPVIIEAELYKQGMEDGINSFPSVYIIYNQNNIVPNSVNYIYRPFINTPEGRMDISPDDYIITNENGERYLCKADVFDMTYEPAENIDNLKTQWISVKDKLPIDRVIVYCVDGYITMARIVNQCVWDDMYSWHDETMWQFDHYERQPLDFVTHWMPLPEPPQEDG